MAGVCTWKHSLYATVSGQNNGQNQHNSELLGWNANSMHNIGVWALTSLKVVSNQSLTVFSKAMVSDVT